MYEPIPYPRMLYKAEHAPIVVHAEAEDQAAQANGWMTSPEAESTSADEPTAPVGWADLTADRMAELHAASVRDVLARIAEIDTPRMVAHVRELEAQHHKSSGGRKTVLKALDEREAQLADEAT